MNKLTIIGLSIVTFVFMYSSICYPSDDTEISYILAIDGNLKKIHLHDNKVEREESILDVNQWSHISSPSLNSKNNELFFEAQNLRETTSAQIYAINLSDSTHQPKKIIEGRSPSINANGTLLAYYKHPNQLWILSLESNENRKISDDIFNGYPALWYTDSDLLYITKEDKLEKINSTTGVKKDTGIEGVAPSALSPKGGKVLCSSNARKIYLYSPDNNKLEVIKEFSFLSVGSFLVWTPDGESFLYTRQTLFKQLQLREAHDLFLYSLKGKEQKILEYVALFGGIFIREK
jgi:hypothetical protein